VQDGREQVIIDDQSVAANQFVRRINDTYYVFGGLFAVPSQNDFNATSDGKHYSLSDGVHVSTSSSLSGIRRGAWMRPRHGWTHRDGAWRIGHNRLALVGSHPGHVDLTHTSGVSQFDSKLSVVNWRGRFLLYTRANLREHGGRYTMVAKSRTANAWGWNDNVYEPFKLIDIEGYERNSSANLYFFAVDNHPFEADMLLSLMPVNMGKAGIDNGDGESFIALSLSCDGEHWSRMTPLLWTVGLQGRTYDHPVDGLLVDNGEVYFLVHTDVNGISLHNGGDIYDPVHGDIPPTDPLWRRIPNFPSQIVKYRLRLDALTRLTQEARAHTRGCSLSSSPM